MLQDARTRARSVAGTPIGADFELVGVFVQTPRGARRTVKEQAGSSRGFTAPDVLQKQNRQRRKFFFAAIDHSIDRSLDQSVE